MTFVRFFCSAFLFLLCCLGSLTAQAQCAPTAPDGACFRLLDAGTKQEVQTVCVGRTVRFVDCSGQQPDPKLIRYAVGSSVICEAAKFDTVSVFTPTQAGTFVITQNTQNPARPASGILIIRTLIVQPTPPPAFTSRACAPQLVEVTVTDTQYKTYTVQVGSLPPVAGTPNAPQQLAAPTGASATVTVTGYTDQRLCSATATQTVTLLPAYQVANLQRLRVQGSTTQFTYGALLADYQYELQVRDAGNYRTVANIPANSTTFSLLNAPNGCFRLRLLNPCQPNAATPVSNELCPVALTATAQNSQNALSWTTEQAGATFEVVRNDQPLARLPAGITQYQDAAVTCGTAYRYRVRAITVAGESESAEVSVTAVSTTLPPAPVLLASYTLTNQVALTVTGTSNGTLTYLRNGTPLATTNARLLRDSLAQPPPAPSCYSVRVQDACGNTSLASPAVCPVVLTAEAADPDGKTARLTWTALGAPDPAAAVTYRLLTLSPDNQVVATQPVTFPVALDQQPPPDQQVLRYRLEATGGGLPAPSYSTIATVARHPKLVMPTAFTPNGDGQNDVLEIKGLFLGKFTLVVMDRGGQEVFRATDRTQTWDGRIGGRPPVPATYVWRFEATDASGQRTVQHGTLTVLR